MADRVLLIRHGETEDNVVETAAKPMSRAAFARFVAGCNDTRLTERGKGQASDLALKLVKVPIACLYASPLSRARDTAAILSSVGGAPPATVLDELRELVPLTDAQANDPSSQEIPLRRQLWPAYARMLLAPKSSDRLDRSFRRLRQAWQRINSECIDGTVAVVGHGWATIVLIRMLQVDPHWRVGRIDLSSCGVTEVVRRGGR
jgi:broad specificity phosphatase PhoE